MCLSKVYKKSASMDNMLLSNIQRIAIDGDSMLFTDLMEHETRITGRLILADLVNGTVIIDTE